MDQPSTSEPGFGALFWQWIRRPRWSVAAPLLLIAFTGVFAWQIFLSPSEVDQGLIELNAAYRETRPLEARIAGFSYAPYALLTGKINEGKLKLAESILSPQPNKPQSPMALYAFGKFLLANGKFAEAIRQFEMALKSDPNNPSLHNDLAVALMEEAFPQPMDKKSDYLTQSREHLEQAIKLDRNATEPLFNLALLYHRQDLWKQAEESWQTYLKNDTRSGWAEEAKRYLREMKEKKMLSPQPKE